MLRLLLGAKKRGEETGNRKRREDGKLLLQPEDLIILKLLSNRPQDRIDVEQIRETQKHDLDTAYMRSWCDKLGVTLE